MADFKLKSMLVSSSFALKGFSATDNSIISDNRGGGVIKIDAVFLIFKTYF